MPFPIDSKFVVETEEKFGVTMPSNFRGKMIRENGGGIEAGSDYWFLYPILDRSNTKRLAQTCNDIIRETMQMRQWQRFPKNAVAIGNNGSAEQLIFLPKSGDPVQLDAAVFWWDHETGEVIKIVDDFAELL